MTMLLLAIASFVTSLLLTERVRAYALRNEVMDRPNERSSHTIPTPRGGGLAIVIAGLLALVAAWLLHIVATRDLLALAPGVAILAAVGWVDDHGGLSPVVRLGAQAAAAAAALAALGGLPSLQVGTWTVPLGFAGTAVALLGIMWSINLFNFMDGIDGIAASQATLVFGLAACLSAMRGNVSLATAAACFAAASLGFLRWNWPPATIFMGDVGSGALGYVAAVLAVAGERNGSVPLLAVGVLGGVFVSDATVTLARRVRRGARPMEAHRDHAYQRMARAWGAHRPVTVAAGVTTLALGVLAATFTFRPALALPMLAVAFVLLLALGLAAERRAPLGGKR